MQPPDKKNIPFFVTKKGCWETSKNPIWLGSTLSLIRNVDKFNFPGKLANEKRQQILSLIGKGIEASSLLKECKIIKAEELSSIEKEFFSEHFLCREALDETGEGSAFVVDSEGEFLALLNFRDHFVLQLINGDENLEKTWEKIVKIENFLGTFVNFAFSPRFGFLTSDPRQCGTALVINLFLHLPALITTKKLEEILDKVTLEGISVKGLQGDRNQLIGDIVIFENLFKLGISEELTLSTMRTLASKLSFEEKILREKLKMQEEHETAEIRDKVSRAYAILLLSYQIEAIEALQALSLIKLGLDLGWISGISQEQLTSLFISSRRAHLLYDYAQPIQHEELPHKRAEFIHKALKEAKLLI